MTVQQGLDRGKCAMMQATQDPEVRALVRVIRDALVYIVRWLENRYGIAK